MNVVELFDSFSCLSLRTLALAIRNPSKMRTYVSFCLKRYDELAGKGLPPAGPVRPATNETICLPAAHTGGGMSFADLTILARVTKVKRPRAIFEMGSYDGLTTAVFLLNAPPCCRIYSLDLPPASPSDEADLRSDAELVASRSLGTIPKAIGRDNYTQLLCDTMKFDPSPYANSIDLGLIDAAHDVEHARNDTIKMAAMMSDEGLVFWHDYGGKGSLRPLAEYLEALGRKFPVYRVPETALAWTKATDLKRASL